jgi:hypothetical protein
MGSAVGIGVSGHSIGSEVTWFPKGEEGVVQREAITRFEMCGSYEIVTESVKVKSS